MAAGSEATERSWAPASRRDVIAIRISRLNDEIRKSERDIQATRELLRNGGDGGELVALEAATHAIEDAQCAAEKRDVASGWRHLDAGREWLVMAFDENQLAAEAAQLARRAQGMGAKGQWIQEQLDFAELPVRDQRLRLQAAMRTRHQHWEYRYQGSDLKAAHLRTLITVTGALIAAFVLGTVAAWIWTAWTGTPRLQRLDAAALMVVVMGAGVLGGSIGSIWSLATAGKRILPEITAAQPWRLARPVFGAGAAGLLFLLIQGNLLLPRFDEPTALIAAGALAGFSERFFLKSVETVSDPDAPKLSREAPAQDDGSQEEPPKPSKAPPSAPKGQRPEGRDPSPEA